MKELFRRKELKYLLDETRHQAFLEALQNQLEPDDFHDYPIKSVYLDTPDYRYLFHCARKPAYKEKLRVRMYANRQHYLEVKKKWHGITHKSRVGLSPSQLTAVLTGNRTAFGKPDGESARIWMEQLCQPAFTVEYHRRAWHWKGDPSLRITLDDSLCWHPPHEQSQPLTKPGEYVLEIKSSSPLPLPLARTLSTLQLQPASVSKAGHAFSALTQSRKRKEICPCII
ncbi:polyphosphate polymerase domain-containing protein [uncultured Faecalibaculum sp.]|uniref:polyphosphate polymerase domain-containing protein n=1 Tax=uncultured Faecalibaculum sp. TaxID=1729681 RepID=UPI00261FFD72|nr:polyphosphate polymerase domain-containing protein [uncultured Faecalibaculum sp.]